MDQRIILTIILFMETSIFTNKTETPEYLMLSGVVGEIFNFWKEIRAYVLTSYPAAFEEWNFPGQKYGWSFHMKDKELVDLKLSK